MEEEEEEDVMRGRDLVGGPFVGVPLLEGTGETGVVRVVRVTGVTGVTGTACFRGSTGADGISKPCQKVRVALGGALLVGFDELDFARGLLFFEAGVGWGRSSTSGP